MRTRVAASGDGKSGAGGGCGDEYGNVRVGRVGELDVLGRARDGSGRRSARPRVAALGIVGEMRSSTPNDNEHILAASGEGLAGLAAGRPGNIVIHCSIDISDCNQANLVIY